MSSNSAMARVCNWQTPNQIVQQLNLGDYTHQTDSAVDIDKPIFQPIPAVVYFSDHEAHRTYTASLSLRNNDKVRMTYLCIFNNANAAPPVISNGLCLGCH
jgi:hypothetical protein